MIASFGASIFGSGTSSTRTSRFPCQVTARIGGPPELHGRISAALTPGRGAMNLGAGRGVRSLRSGESVRRTRSGRRCGSRLVPGGTVPRTKGRRMDEVEQLGDRLGDVLEA